MTAARLLATTTRVLRHTVRIVHASSEIPIRGLSARLEPVPHGWSLLTLPDTLVVSASTDVAEPLAPPDLVVTLTDGALVDVLVVPPLAGLPPATLVVPLVTETIDVAVHPVPMTLTVVLTTPTTGAPRTGRTVTARPVSGAGPTVALPEVKPGAYCSAAVEWTAALTPADVCVGGSPLRTVAVDLTRPATTVHLVDTT